jgi:hypothetical protein
VQLVAAHGVPEGIGLGQPHAELIQHVGTADDATVATVMLRVVALQVVERGVAAQVADGDAWAAVGQSAWLHRDGDGRLTQPARSVFFRAVRIQDAGAVVLQCSSRDSRPSLSLGWCPQRWRQAIDHFLPRRSRRRDRRRR